MKKFYAFILGFTAIMLAVAAAYFSVFGLSKLFVGAALSVIIMTGTLEFSKIVVVSFLHQYWSKLAKMLRTYLLAGTIVLMIITSAGIYGFLSNAYSRVSTEMDKMGGNIELLNKKIEIKKEEKIRFDEQIKTKNDRVVTLTNLRKSQETRLDSLYQRGWTASAKKTETVIKQADDNIAKLNEDINNISIKIDNVNDSIAKFETNKLETANSDIAAEVGPLKYISKLTGAEMDTVVNYLILLLIIVFDPLAVALIVSTSSMFTLIRKEKEEGTAKKRDEDFKKKVQYLADEEGNFKLQTEKVEPEKIEDKIEELQKNEEEKTESIDSEAITNESPDNESVIEKIEKIEDKIEEVENIESKDNVVAETIENPVFNVNQNTIVAGVFTATTIDNSANDNKVTKQSLYSQLLYIFYNDGNRKKGDEVPSYVYFKKTIEDKGIYLNEKDIKDFLLICNLFKITIFKENSGYFDKNFEEANTIVSII